jgi:His/Glu/Gln/Arg/opine family amino acid ABC transporter permease subunit
LDVATIWAAAPFILRGAGITIALSAVVICISTPLAFFVALGRNSPVAALSWPLGIASSFARGIPPLLLLFASYFLLPAIGLRLDPFDAAAIGMIAYTTFYFAESLRAGLAAVPPGQHAAARALALPPVRTALRIILPQAIPAALPSYIGQATEVIKGSALTSSIAVPETMGNAYQLILATNRPFEILLLVAIIYAVLDSILLLAQGALDRRWRPSRG